MERNYQKELALALEEIKKLTEEKIAYRALYDDTLEQLKKVENNNEQKD